MAISNIHLAKNLDGSRLDRDQIKLGWKITFPSGAGGVLTGVCKRLNSEAAEFVSTNEDWPLIHVIKFNAPDLTDEEFVALLETIRRIRPALVVPSCDERKLIHRGTELGYVSSISTSQISLTESAFIRIEELQSA